MGCWESGMADAMMVSSDQRGRLLMTKERVKLSTDRIKESTRSISVSQSCKICINNASLFCMLMAHSTGYMTTSAEARRF
ncbi:hypothetical protein QYF36_026613 [Acer negundo]|nr:hypothetical protein QYF36_026613 [Acer negundo]